MSETSRDDAVVNLQRERERLRESQRPTPKPVETGGSGPNDPGMEARVTRLEEDFREIKADLKAMRADLTDIKLKIAAVEGRISGVDGRITGVDGRISGLEGRIAALPTSLQLLGFAVAVFVAAGVLRFFEPRMFPAAPTPPAITAPR